mmetsp:Transcript_35894/g.65880  ORF Transcript_35894/g.65880 Transcript_35894/m.65880 type:complete len:288 (+) Transcript_35894:75-938(+)
MSLSLGLSFFTDHFSTLERDIPEAFQDFLNQDSCPPPATELGPLGTVYRLDLAILCVFGFIYSLHLAWRSSRVSAVLSISSLFFAMMHVSALLLHCLTPQVTINAKNWASMKPLVRSFDAGDGMYQWRDKYYLFACDTGFTGAAASGGAVLFVQLRLRKGLSAFSGICLVLGLCSCLLLSFAAELSTPRISHLAEAVYILPAVIAVTMALALHEKCGPGSRWIGFCLLSLLPVAVNVQQFAESWWCAHAGGHFTVTFWIFLGCICCYEGIYRYTCHHASKLTIMKEA